MPAKIRLLALDMDGTTLNASNEVSQENRKWIQKAVDAGILVMFATGRPQREILSFKKELGLDSPMVLLNGSEVWNASGECIERHFLNQEDLQQLHQFAVKYETWFWGYTSDGPVNKENWQEKYLSSKWMKFGFHSDNLNIIKDIRELLKGWALEVTSSGSHNIEVNPKGVTKASGVRRIGELVGIEMSEVMAIGDSLNDYPLFVEAGLSIAMGNGREDLKQIADGVTDTNVNDGVAKAIQNYLF
ncbi:HAD superfamily hydrolase (TIGR01484 family) [Pullulanibacillus pueri]|uniref:5-amino-6-(5-phospho-D-ribitylamino)uracil phosphatase YcsE n=1 Tax=Pullulanibacillus pueri TaxID=1437324 RepID=A0A8J2ZVS3_9BACL|nr:Cof-type HAD-IIB family hydrolase [Pullulanibacillus pueri]MBM7682095.1 HAD superfamily hydrolase (TIGR01484 family) [Pullulanibacillus pueri]GGH80001.1 5-amino-6-(5-phospho-D-ribitylamino)uracil phosphatase YcsE [Pullulanibacillus pueri]